MSSHERPAASAAGTEPGEAHLGEASWGETLVTVLGTAFAVLFVSFVAVVMGLA